MSSYQSESDSDAPETVQQSTAKGQVDRRDRTVRDFNAQAASKRKAVNKAREESRKAAAAERKRKLSSDPASSSSNPAKSKSKAQHDEAMSSEDEDDRELSPNTRRLHLRMTKAMQSAEGESQESDASEEEQDSEESDEEDEESMELDINTSKISQPNRSSRPSITKANNLPDSIFSAAKAAKDALDAKLAAREEKKKQRSSKSVRKDNIKKKAKSRTSKDTIVGSTIVRALGPATHKVPAPASEHRKQMMKNRLTKKSSRYQRRSANLAIPAGSAGAPVGFARSRS